MLCDNMEYFPEIAAACNIPIATGERLFTKYDFKRLLARGRRGHRAAGLFSTPAA